MSKDRDLTAINPTNRAILVDWVHDVTWWYRLHQQTSWLCINLIDRFFAIENVKRFELQLVGVACILIASKFADNGSHAFTVSDCMEVTEYSAKTITKAEMRISMALKWQIYVPTAYHFISGFLDVINAPEKIRFLTCYYAERNIQEYEILQYSPYEFIAGALYAALHQDAYYGSMSSRSMSCVSSLPIWPFALEEASGLSETELIPVARTILANVASVTLRPLDGSGAVSCLLSVRDVYSTPEKLEVARLPLPVI